MPARTAPSPADLALLSRAAPHANERVRRDVGENPALPAPTVVELAHERVELHPDRALYWPARRTLFVADVHLGKEHVFGRHGIPIPAGISEHGLARLARLVRGTGAERLVVLGDLIHDTPSASEGWVAALAGFLDAHVALRVEICAGNHDRPDARARLDPRLAWLDEPHLDGPFAYRHHPLDGSAAHDVRDDGTDGYVLAGHLHPVSRLGHGRDLRQPVFWARPGQLVMPAFGEFTGGCHVRPGPGDRLWAAGPERVVRVPVRPRRV